MRKMRKVSCTLLGDGAIGKTTLAQAFAFQKPLTHDYTPTVFDFCEMTLTVDNATEITFEIRDCGGQEDYNELRPLAYDGTSVFVACYSVARRSSFEDLQGRFLGHLKRLKSTVPVVLVGLKTDLLNSPTPAMDPVMTHEGERLASKRKFAGFVECSVATGVGVFDVFKRVVEVAMSQDQAPRKKRGLFGGLFGKKKASLVVENHAVSAPRNIRETLRVAVQPGAGFVTRDLHLCEGMRSIFADAGIDTTPAATVSDFAGIVGHSPAGAAAGGVPYSSPQPAGYQQQPVAPMGKAPSAPEMYPNPGMGGQQPPGAAGGGVGGGGGHQPQGGTPPEYY